jgi:AcrR family transcriptional regulator
MPPKGRGRCGYRGTMENDASEGRHFDTLRSETAGGSEAPGFRSLIASTAVRLYATHGFETTSVDEIARAVGISRSKFFRQFRSKEDVVFADHDELVEQARAFLAEGHEDPWLAVCEAAVLVFEHYVRQGEQARERYRVVNGIPALRDRELITVFRYERLFNAYLRGAVPGLVPLDGIRFVSAVVSTNNYFLRSLMRDEKPPGQAELRISLDEVRRLHGVLGADPADKDEVVVAVFPRCTPPAEISRQLQLRLSRHKPTQ